MTLRHFRRYNEEQLRKIIPPQFEILHLNYVNVAVLPIVFAVRKFRALKQSLGMKADSRFGKVEKSAAGEVSENVLRKVKMGGLTVSDEFTIH